MNTYSAGHSDGTWYSGLAKEVEEVQCCNESVSGSVDSGLSGDRPMVEVESITLYFTGATEKLDRTPVAQTPQHVDSAQKAILYC